MSDLTLFPIKFDKAGYMAEVKSCINIALDQLSGHMHDVICRVIAQCSEAANVMIIEAQRNVKEISRKVTDDTAEIEVGIDEGAIAGGEQGYVRVMVVLHGNLAGGPIFTKPGQSTWKKHVTGRGPSSATVEYALPFFEQPDRSEVMMKSFEHDIAKHVKDFESIVYGMLDAIDYSRYLIGGG